MSLQIIKEKLFFSGYRYFASGMDLGVFASPDLINKTVRQSRNRAEERVHVHGAGAPGTGHTRDETFDKLARPLGWSGFI